jgi:hypothetical protein
MPLQDTPAAHEKLLVWGDTELTEMCQTYFPELDPAVVLDEALAMRLYVRDNHEIFIQPKDTNDVSKGVVLALTGHGSVFDTLFKRSDVCSKPIPAILHIADYMIAFMWQSCNGERAASHINIVKRKERTGLGDDTFEAAVFNTFNMPELHEVNTEPIMKKWIAAGRKWGTFKDSDPDAPDTASKVIRRHMEVKTPTFLYK